MFYHDHAWGITRLNVYAGEAAGYLLTDATEQKLIGTGGALAGLGVGIPLVIQDRTFVPSADAARRAGPDVGRAQLGRHGRPLVPPRLHARAEPRRPVGHERLSAAGCTGRGSGRRPRRQRPDRNPYYNMDPIGTEPDDFTTPREPCNLDDPSTWQYQVDPFCEPELIPGTPNISRRHGAVQRHADRQRHGLSRPRRSTRSRTASGS